MDTVMNDAATTMKTVQANFKDTAETVNAQATAGMEHAQGQMKDQMDKAMRKAEAMAALGQGNLDALVKSSQIWASGMQSLQRQFAATAQAQMEHTLSGFKALGSVRSVKDAMDMQSGMARAAMEKAMAETTRLTDAGYKLAEEAMAPLTARVSVTMEALAKTA